MMRVLIIGHHVQNVQRAFEDVGCPTCTVAPDQNLIRDTIQWLKHELCLDPVFDLMIAFPPCKYLCSSGLHWNTRRPERVQQTEDALEFVRFLMRLPVPRKCIENPVGCISSRIRPPDQIIQPYDFGHDASKKTCLWLDGLPRLQPTQRVPGRLVNGRERWSNQFDSGQNRLVSATDRAVLRAERYAGIARAMADQWTRS